MNIGIKIALWLDLAHVIIILTKFPFELIWAVSHSIMCTLAPPVSVYRIWQRIMQHKFSG